MLRILYVTLIIAISLFSCNQHEKTDQPINYSDKKTDSDLIKANKFLLERDKEQIKSYLKRRSWNPEITESGLWYEIYEKTTGESIKQGDIVKYSYKIELLDGTLCYSSDSTGATQVKIGHSGKESGLEEGFLKMRVGEKAHFILPPHLAHGLIGDMNKIPNRSTIVYDVEILKVIDF